MEDQKSTQERIPHLTCLPAGIRFLSCEPLLERLPDLDLTGIDWVIVGGESGPRCRPMALAWAREIRDRCQVEGVARRHTADPFSCGLDREVVLRLLAGRFDRRDLSAYYRTAHFRHLKALVIETYGSCVLCGCRYRKRPTAHHRRYRSLFKEDVLRDVSCRTLIRWTEDPDFLAELHMCRSRSEPAKRMMQGIGRKARRPAFTGRRRKR